MTPSLSRSKKATCRCSGVSSPLYTSAMEEPGLLLPGYRSKLNSRHKLKDTRAAIKNERSGFFPTCNSISLSLTLPSWAGELDGLTGVRRFGGHGEPRRDLSRSSPRRTSEELACGWVMSMSLLAGEVVEVVGRAADRFLWSCGCALDYWKGGTVLFVRAAPAPAPGQDVRARVCIQSCRLAAVGRRRARAV